MDDDLTGNFEYQVAVRWRDMDALGHVNHAVFLTYLEVGRDAFYIQMLGNDPIYVVARLEIDFRAEVSTHEEWIRVRVEVERLGTTSLTTRETITTAGGTVAARARVVTVRWDQAAHRSIPFSADERERLNAAMVRAGSDAVTIPGT
jgi:acyl-CoA thioester hydrolase